MKWHRHVQSRIEGRTCKPTIRSFILSFIWDISPSVSAAVVTYFMYEKYNSLIIILDVLTGLFSFYLIFQTIFVHSQKIIVFDEGISIFGLSRPYGIRWSDIEKATVRERHNIISGTDKLIILFSRDGYKLAYPISILSKDDQNTILSEIRRRIPTSTKFDKAYL